MPEVKANKATPSKAASQGAVTLAMELIKEPHIEKWAALIDEKLADLLEKAQTLNVYIEARWGDTDATIQGLNRPLKSALEPWKAGE